MHGMGLPNASGLVATATGALLDRTTAYAVAIQPESAPKHPLTQCHTVQGGTSAFEAAVLAGEPSTG